MLHQQLGSSCAAHRRRPSSHPCLLAAGHTPPAAWPSRQASGQPGACATRLELPWPRHLASAASAELQAHGVGSGMDGREGGSRGTDAPAETCLGQPTCRLSSQVIANGPISANLAVADPMVAMATARCVGNGVKTMSPNSTYRRVV